jgi:ABC-type amino acid transport system permease subunit
MSNLVRNIPLLLQIFFWYFAVLRAVPGKREKWSLFDLFHLNIAGLRGPKPIFAAGSEFIGYALIIGIIATVFVARWAHKRQDATGQQFPTFWTGVGLILGLPVLTFFLSGMPISLDYPVFLDTGPKLQRGFQLGTGFNVIPEFLALTAALALYTASFIAEIVRAGIQAVSHGQTEAAHALGSARSDPAARGHSAGHAGDHSAAHQPVSEPDEKLVPGCGDRLSGPGVRRRYGAQSDGPGHRDHRDLDDRLSVAQPDHIGLHELVQPAHGACGTIGATHG